LFGPHLIIDGSRCDTRKLADRNLVEQVLNAYPDAIGMTKIGGPYMFEYQAPDPAYSGVSGLVVIAESHIALHTFPELDYFTMDIFSCKNFDHERAIEYIRDAFDVKEMDRMLVQRGLSFRGPHHGKHGATDELIAAAQARLEAGIISKETVLVEEPAVLAAEREVALARHAEAAQPGGENGQSAQNGRMVWPRYGVTPDYGTYGAAAEETNAASEPCEPYGRGGAKIIPLGQSQAAQGTDGRVLVTAEPVQVNPTASVSGLLDKLSHTGRGGRALGRAMAEWERLARDPDATIALALSTPVVAEGLRELLVYAVERHYVDTVVLSADDLFADLYEALGYTHFYDGETMVASGEGRERTLAFFAEFLASDEARAAGAACELWRALGQTLSTRAPRKGLLQAAAAADVPLFTPDLGTSAFGTALLAARVRGSAVTLDGGEDLVALARVLAGRPRLGVIRSGETTVDAFLAQAREVVSVLGQTAPMLVGSISLGASALGSGEHAVAVPAEAGIALPLLVTGLAQRIPGARHTGVISDRGIREEQAALA
jgi:S-adenosylmethionine decarboxylase